MADDTRTGGPLAIVVDDREARSGLPDALSARWPRVSVGRLPVGDVEIGPRVLVERKTVDDFVTSVVDGRLFEQCWALCGAARRPLLIVEGRDAAPFLRLPESHLRGALIAVTVSYRIPLLRTDDVRETAATLAHIAAREERRLSRDGDRPRPTPGRAALDVLGALPGVGDLRARLLLDRFGTLAAALRATEAELRDVPGIGPGTARRIRAALDDGTESIDGVREVAAYESARTRDARSPGRARGRARRHREPAGRERGVLCAREGRIVARLASGSAPHGPRRRRRQVPSGHPAQRASDAATPLTQCPRPCGASRA